jgi:hypothetical protein
MEKNYSWGAARICIGTPFISELIKEELIFSNLVDIPSYPEEYLGLRDFIIFSTSLDDENFRLIFGKGVLKDCSK